MAAFGLLSSFGSAVNRLRNFLGSEFDRLTTYRVDLDYECEGELPAREKLQDPCPMTQEHFSTVGGEVRRRHSFGRYLGMQFPEARKRVAQTIYGDAAL